jgi:zinc transport system ATP-binding protein
LNDAASPQGDPHHKHDHHHHDPSAHHHGHGHHDAAAPLDALIIAKKLVLRRGARTVIDAVDMYVAPSEIVTLVGPNGAGKTSLARLLLGLEQPNGGEIVSKPGLRIGYVPQRFEIDRAIPVTVARFLTLARPLTSAQVDQCLKEVGASPLADRQIGELSGGEMQRVLLARALVRDPQLLVLDEPTRGVDVDGEAGFFDLIERLRTDRRCGVLLVSHDLHIVMARSDRVVCLNRHICCSGVPRAVAQAPEFQQIFGAAAAAHMGVYVHRHDHEHGPDGTPIR